MVSRLVLSLVTPHSSLVSHHASLLSPPCKKQRSAVTNILTTFSDELAATTARAMQSLVRVRNGRQGAGAGTICHKDGLILTNAHVIAGGRGARRRVADAIGAAITVVLPDGRELPATVLAVDAQRDLAALRVQASDLPAMTLGDSRHLQSGNFVLALGFPWGVTGGATTGVVIGVGAGLPELGGDDREWLAASLHLRPGHSGGPMVDAQGRLVGINTMMNGPDVGVAVPVHVAAAFLKAAYERQAARVVQV